MPVVADYTALLILTPPQRFSFDDHLAANRQTDQVHSPGEIG
jgi:hypothetical protein